MTCTCDASPLCAVAGGGTAVCVNWAHRSLFPLLLKDGLLIPYSVCVVGYFFGTVWPAVRLAEPPVSASLRPRAWMRWVVSVRRLAVCIPV